MEDIMTINTPDDWRLYRLGQLFRERKEKGSADEFPPLSVTKKGIVPQLETAAKTDDVDNRKIIRIGDFVINSRSDRKGSGGLSTLEGSTSQISTVLKPVNIIPRFAHHLLRSIVFQEEFYRWGNGIVADLWTTRYSNMKNIRLAIPSDEMQKTIANFLDRETARIDKLIEKKTKLISLLIEKRKSIISSTVNDQKNYRQSKNTKTRLKYLVELVDESADPNENCPYVGLDAIMSWTGEIRLSPSNAVEEEPTGKRFRPGDILLGKLRPYLAKVTTPNFSGQCSSEALVLRPRINLDVRFLRYRLVDASTIDLINSSTYGVKMPRASWSFIGNMCFNIPIYNTQKSIVDFLDNETGKLDAIVEKVKKSIELLKEFRSSLITEAVTGRLNIQKRGVK